MTITHAIGYGSNKIIRLIVRGLALSRIHPNVLTFLGLVINMVAAYMLAVGQFRWGAAVIIGAGLFDMVDGRVARETNRVTRFGGFFDSVLDRYSDCALLVGLLISVFQALTQINEQTLTFVPKILAVFAALLLAGPWLLQSIVSYTADLFSMLPQMAR